MGSRISSEYRQKEVWKWCPDFLTIIQCKKTSLCMPSGKKKRVLNFIRDFPPPSFFFVTPTPSSSRPFLGLIISPLDFFPSFSSSSSSSCPSSSLFPAELYAKVRTVFFFLGKDACGGGWELTNRRMSRDKKGEKNFDPRFESGLFFSSSSSSPFVESPYVAVAGRYNKS